MSPTYWDSLGLSSNEIKIYQALLKTGAMTAGNISKTLDMKRATVYKALYAMEKKDIIRQDGKGKIIRFVPAPPDKLLDYADHVLREHEHARDTVKRLLPDLVSQYVMTVEQPIFQTFEGVEGIKKVYMDTIRVGKPVKALLQIADDDPEIYPWLKTYYTRERVKNGIHVQAIVADSKWSREYVGRSPGELRKTIIIPRRKLPIRHEINIYGDKVAFISFRKDKKLIGVIMTHPEIAQTMRAWFDLTWETLSEKIT